MWTFREVKRGTRQLGGQLSKYQRIPGGRMDTLWLDKSNIAGNDTNEIEIGQDLDRSKYDRSSFVPFI